MCEERNICQQQLWLLMDWWNDQIFLLEPAYEIRCVSSLFVISSDCHGYWTFMLWFVSLDCSFSWLERKEVPKACLVYCCLMNHCHNSIATPMHPIVSHRSSSQLYKWYGFYRQPPLNDAATACVFQVLSDVVQWDTSPTPAVLQAPWPCRVWLLLGLAVVFWIRILSWCLRGPKQYLDNDTWCWFKDSDPTVTYGLHSIDTGPFSFRRCFRGHHWWR